MTWRSPFISLLVAAYWGGMAVFLFVAFRVGLSCAQPSESGDQCSDNYLGGAWQSDTLAVLSVVAFLAALLVFTRPGLRWRLLVYEIQLGLTAFVAWLFWLSVDLTEGGLADDVTTTRWPWFAIAAAAELAALLAIVISWPRSSVQEEQER